MAHLTIRVLGPLQVSLDGEFVSGFASDKVRALLAYLVLSPDRLHPREMLAGLLWPEYPERSARTNLRNALANLRQVIGDGAALPPYLHCTRQTIQFNGESDYWLDAGAFESLVTTVPPETEGLEQAVDLVRGLFLEGLSLADSAPFEEWLLLRREHSGRQLVEALHSLAVIYEACGGYEQALVHVRRRVELEPWEEEGQRQLMRLLVLNGQRSEALARYEAFRGSLWRELGAEPSAETRALQEDILSGALARDPAQGPGPLAPVHTLPASPTPFFGRADELAALEAKLDEPDTRLVTLTGLGGSGKTRLALEVGSRLAERERQALADESPLTFAHGIVFVPLAALDSVEGLVSALAEALHLRLEGGDEQLLQVLSQKKLLLILDNLEQLLDGVGFLVEILRAAPGVKILTTSRERLGTQGEHVLSLGGLRYPGAEREPVLAEAAEVEGYLATYAALQLLAEGVGRVRPGSSPSATDLPVMLEICRLVDGLPLALELAASWADVLSLDDILVEVRRSPDLMQADWPDMPERQRSMRAVFDASWQRLNPAEQALFSSLTVFRGGFAREAAGQVLAEAEGMPLRLAALVRKSFLQYDQDRDRYQIHRLLRQFGAEKLAQEPAREAEVRDRHSGYHIDALQRWEADLVGSRQQAALSEMEAESDNIRAAWMWAVEKARADCLDRSMEGLYHFYWHSGRYREGEIALRAAADRSAAAGKHAEGISDRATWLRVGVRALAWQSRLQQALGQMDAARRNQQQALTTLEDPALVGEDTRLERAILAHCTGSTVTSVDFERARQQFKESYVLFRDLDLQWGMARALIGWGNLSAILGDHQDAQRHLEEGLAICRAQGNQSGASWSLVFLAYLARTQGRFEEASALAWQAYDASLGLGVQSRSGMQHMSVGNALEYLGRFEEAHTFLKEGQALASSIGNRSRYAQVHSALVRIGLHQGRYKEAREDGVAGLALAREHGPRFCVGLNHLLLGCLDLAEGALVGAVEHIEQSIAVYEGYEQTDDLSWSFAILALMAFGLGNMGEARQHLCRALQIAVDVRTVPPILWALPATALLLAQQGENERAVELYALASRYPFVANSCWFEDVAGRQMAAVAAKIPPEVVAEAQERGRRREPLATAAELVTELGC